MRLLIITPSYYPSFFPRAFRWTSLCCSLKKSGIEIDVVTSGYPGSVKHEVIDDVHVHRVNYSSFDHLISSLFSKQIELASFQKEFKYSQQSSNSFKSLVFKTVRRLWRLVYWPDGAIIWYWAARKKAFQLLREKEIEAVITVSHPFTSHIIGLSCKHKFKNIKWILDVGDPFSFMTELPPNNFFLYKGLNKLIENRVLKKADKVICTAEGTKVKYQTLFPIVNGKIYVVPPLSSPGILGNTTTKNSYFDSNFVNLAYVGGFYRNIREPIALLKLLRLLKDQNPNLARQVQVHFFGGISDEILELFEDFDDINSMVKIRGGVPRNEVPDILLNCDVLINIGNTTGYQLPSKSVDYMNSCKPIINICYSRNDSFKEFLKEYPFCFNLILDHDPKQEELDLFVHVISNHQNLSVDPQFVERLTKPYSIDTISNQYFKIIDSV